MDKLSVADIKKCVKLLKKNAVKPRIIKTQDEADYFNLLDRKELGIQSNWKVGDEYYVA